MNVSTTVANEGNYGGTWVRTSVLHDTSDTGTSFAVGGEYQLNSSAALTLSYNSVSSGSDVEVSSVNLGYKANY